jgi:hypothetical protein
VLFPFSLTSSDVGETNSLVLGTVHQIQQENCAVKDYTDGKSHHLRSEHHSHAMPLNIDLVMNYIKIMNQ